MIRYKQNILELLKMNGYSTYKIRKEKIFSEAQLQYFRNGTIVREETLNKLCCLLNCQPGDILEYIPDDATEIDR
ncbi:MAG: helix-turn-helix transcriptional regulator [Coprobacillus cateniformis]|nr:helix-turn-helix transcriptional regulator [Coprobacillus cateniformis]